MGVFGGFITPALPVTAGFELGGLALFYCLAVAGMMRCWMNLISSELNHSILVHLVYTSEWIKKKDIWIVEKAGWEDWTLWENSCAHELFIALWTMNCTYVYTCFGMQEINPHHILCSECSYTHTNNLIPISVPLLVLHIILCIVWTCSFNHSTKVIDMPQIHIQSCLDQDGYSHIH